MTTLEARQLIEQYRMHHWAGVVDIPGLAEIAAHHDHNTIITALDHWREHHDRPPTALELEVALIPRETVHDHLAELRQQLRQETST